MARNMDGAGRWGRLGLLLAGVSLAAITPALARLGETPRAKATRPAGHALPQPRPAGALHLVIPEGALEPALIAYGEATGVKLVYPSAVTAGLRTQGAAGLMTPAEALERLLAGTGLAPRREEDSTTTVVDAAYAQLGGAAARAEPIIALDTITVQGINPTATIGPPPAPYAGGQVATGTRLGILGNRNIFETPFSVVGITEQKLKNDQARSVRDALVSDPSVLAVHNRNGGRDDLSVRGFGVFPTQILYDALPGLTDEYTIPVTGVERVELFKGPSALINGISLFGGVGGTVNIVPKRAPDAGVTEFTARYISNRNFGGDIDVGRRFGSFKEFGVRLGLSYEGGDIYRRGSDPRLGVATLGLDYRGDRVRWSGDVVYQDTKQDCSGPYITFAPTVATLRAPKPKVNQCAPWHRFENSNLAAFSRLEVDLTENVTAFAAGGIRDYNQLSVGRFPTVVDTAGTTTGGTSVSLAHRTGYALQGGLRGKFSTGPVTHNITLGYSQVQRDTENFFQGGVAPYTSNLYRPFSPARPAILDSLLSRSFSPLDNAVWTGYVAANTLSFLDERVLVTAGVRHQNIRSEGFQSGVSYDKSAVTPIYGVVVKPLNGLSVYASYVEGLTEGPRAPITAANPGAIFAPTVTDQHEVGAKVDFGRIAATLAYFSITRPFAVTDPVTNIFSEDGKQTNSGVEFTVFGEPVAGLRVIGGVAYTKSKLTGTAGGRFDGNEAAGVPNWQLVGSFEWDTPFVNNLTLIGRAIHVSDAKRAQDNLFDVPAWTRVDVGARYVIKRADGRDITLRGTVENLLGKTYWVSSSGGLTVGPGRTFLLSASLTL